MYLQNNLKFLTISIYLSHTICTMIQCLFTIFGTEQYMEDIYFSIQAYYELSEWECLT